MIKAIKKLYSPPETDVIRMMFAMNLLAGSGNAGHFIIEEDDDDGSSGAGFFQPGD